MSLNNVIGIIRRRKNSIISLRLRFLEIPHKIMWVSCGVHFKGLGVQKGTQTPCWLRPCRQGSMTISRLYSRGVFGQLWVYGSSLLTISVDMNVDTTIHNPQVSLNNLAVANSPNSTTNLWVKVKVNFIKENFTDGLVTESHLPSLYTE